MTVEISHFLRCDFAAFRFSASLERVENVSVIASRAPTLFVTRALRDPRARAREPR